MHEPVYGKKSHKTQEIEIYFNFIGKVELPSVSAEPTDWEKIEQGKDKGRKRTSRSDINN